jgi:hypothetical protein
MKLLSTQSPEVYVPQGFTAILGFQQVLTNKDKVFVWVRQEVERPESTDRHKTTRLANNTERKAEWGKSVWLKSAVWEHFGKAMESLGVTRERLFTFQDDPMCDKWITRGDGTRQFLFCYILNPLSEVSGKPVNIQVTQSIGKAPADIYRRAFEESTLGNHKYEDLLAKYKDKAMVKSYSPSVNERTRTVVKSLMPVYVEQNGLKMPVYEESEVVLGEPNHKFVNFERFEAIPIDVIEFNEDKAIHGLVGEVTIVGSKMPEEKQLTLFDGVDSNIP